MNRVIYATFGVFFCFVVGVALAGAEPSSRSAAVGCHGAVAVQDAGCHGRVMRAPAVAAAAGCHGSRITAAERRETRSAVRHNARVTREQFRDAARQGTVSSVNVEAPTYTVEQPACVGTCNP
jgi:hypothetical protein